MFLARKIARAKWKPTVELSLIRADAITTDLRTEGDELSFWKCEDGSRGDDNPGSPVIDVSSVAMAIASENVSFGKIDIVWFPVGDLEQDVQSWECIEAETPIADLNDLHVHASSLNYSRLGDLAQRIVRAIDDDRFRRFDPDEIVDLLIHAVNEKRLDVERLKGKVQEAVRRRLSDGMHDRDPRAPSS